MDSPIKPGTDNMKKSAPPEGDSDKLTPKV
jgi:hypothetical protein